MLVPLVVVGWLLLSGGGGGSTNTANRQDCASFSSQAVRDFCNGVTKGDVLDCSSFTSRDEATRFVLAHDPKDTNKLEQPAGSGSYCSSLPVKFANGSASATPVGSSGASGSNKPAVTPTPKATDTPAPKTYTVVAGDNPTSIARKLGVPADQIDAWVGELLSINHVSANALAVGQTLILPSGTTAQTSGGGSTSSTNLANTGGPTGSNPTATKTAGGSAPTATTAATTPQPTTAGATATTVPTSTTVATATATNTPAPTATQQSQPASLTVSPSTISPGGSAAYTGHNFTPNDTTTVTLIGFGLNLGSGTGPNTDATGSFSDTGNIDAKAPAGTYTLTITDSHGKSASATVKVQ